MTGPRIVVAPGSFKGSLSAPDAAAAIARGVRTVFPGAVPDSCPVADGGEGTVAALVAASGGHLVAATATGPLGTPVAATWGVLGDGRTAVVEAAAASGLGLVPKAARDPRRATTFGTGELVRAALDAGFRRLVLGLGGTATNDAGAGFLAALGARLLDEAGREVPPGGAALARLASIDTSGLDPRLAACEIVLASDVDSPLTGPGGASAVYGPQKGADPEAVRELDAALARFAAVAGRVTGRDVAARPGAGAAGGLGAALLAFTPAVVRPGIDVVLAAVGFERRARGAALVLTGEGRLDAQTARGKAPLGVARAARALGVPVVALVGEVTADARDLAGSAFDAVIAIAPPSLERQEAIARAAELLEEAAAKAVAGWR